MDGRLLPMMSAGQWAILTIKEYQEANKSVRVVLWSTCFHNYLSKAVHQDNKGQVWSDLVVVDILFDQLSLLLTSFSHKW